MVVQDAITSPPLISVIRSLVNRSAGRYYITTISEIREIRVQINPIAKDIHLVFWKM